MRYVGGGEGGGSSVFETSRRQRWRGSFICSNRWWRGGRLGGAASKIATGEEMENVEGVEEMGKETSCFAWNV